MTALGKKDEKGGEGEVDMHAERSLSLSSCALPISARGVYGFRLMTIITQSG
jgi:hypothetical protein